MADFHVGNKTNNRRFPACFGRRPDLAKFRREEAKERQEAYDKLTNAEKLAKLDMLFGKGLGATKQRAKLSIKAA